MKSYSYILVLAVLFSSQLPAQVPWSQFGAEECIPSWVHQVFNDLHIEKKYPFTYHVNPFYLRGDFNGDGKPDVAILVREAKTKKVGIAICHFGENKVYIVGAGKTYDDGRHDSFNWMDAWVVRPGREGKEVISTWRTESSGGVLSWNGKEYVWKSFPYD